MKKVTLLLSLITVSASALFSQYRYTSLDEYPSWSEGTIYRYGLTMNVNPNQKITLTRKNKKGDTKSVSSYQLNGDTKLVEEIYINKSGKEKSKRVNHYEGKNFVGSDYSKNGKLKSNSKVTYNGKYRVSYIKTNAKGKVLVKSTNSYTENEYDVIDHKGKNFGKKRKKRTENIVYKKGGEKQYNKWVYEYDENGKQTVTTFYNAKNKVKFVWDYTCKDEGALITSKNQVNYCNWKETKDGMLIEVTRSTSAKGKIKKTIKKYDADTNLVLGESYIDDALKTKVTYDKDFMKPLIWESYKKGVLRNKFIYVYDESGKVLNTKSYYKKMDQISSEAQYIYENGQLVSVKNYRKEKLVDSYAMSYI